MGKGKLYAVLVTYRRPAELSAMLAALQDSRGSDKIERLVVVDNSPDPATRQQVDRHAAAGNDAQYIPSPENLGSAGGNTLGMKRVLEVAADDDWILMLDDGDPPVYPGEIDAVLRFGRRMVERVPATAGVAVGGARIDTRRGRIIRTPDEKLLGGPVEVGYLSGNGLPVYRAGVVRSAGMFRSELFFGRTDVEYGMRLRRAGYRLWIDGELAQRRREAYGRLGMTPRKPVRTIDEPVWRDYYRVRNLIAVMRSYGHVLAALRVTVVIGVLKPLANLPRRPGTSLRRLAWNWRAIRDGWWGRLGRVYEP